MDLATTLKAFICGKSRHAPDYPRWPKRDEVETWMRGKVAHYREHCPGEAYRLFDLSSGDYLPLTVHAAGNFASVELAAYRRLKAEHPDLVELARLSPGHFLSRSRIHDPEDWPAEAMLP